MSIKITAYNQQSLDRAVANARPFQTLTPDQLNRLELLLTKAEDLLAQRPRGEAFDLLQQFAGTLPL